MLETPHFASVRLCGSSVLRAVDPLMEKWLITFDISIAALVTFSLLTLTTLLFYFLFRCLTPMQVQPVKPFPFMELPPELRNMVYDYLVEDPCYPPPPTCTKHHNSPLNWVLPTHWPSNPHSHSRKQSNWILLANKQINAEYMDVVCKKATFHLTVSPSNYTATVPTTGTLAASAATVADQKKKIWTISPDTVKQLRKCDIKLITTSSMLGVPDPRKMKTDEWALARQIREELKPVEKVQELNLHVKAIGDPLWNPLWVWYHASQSFKTMGTAEDAVVLGADSFSSFPCSSVPKLNRITFSLDTWSPGENYLERDPANSNHWAWFCLKGHCVGADGGTEMTVREFCARLYTECRVCRPDLESEDEDEVEEGEEDEDGEEEEEGPE